MIEITDIWITDDAVWIRTQSGLEACEYFADYPRLKNASHAQRKTYEVDEFGISWPELDEDLSFEGFLQTKFKNPLKDIFMSHPELNASAVARNLNISQSLFAQYMNGMKKPSEKRLYDILAAIDKIAKSISNDINRLMSAK